MIPREEKEEEGKGYGSTVDIGQYRTAGGDFGEGGTANNPVHVPNRGLRH